MIDLHMHSNNSDGTNTVTELLELAELEKLNIISLTDHDKVSGYDELIKNRNKFSGKVITGCEITTSFRGNLVEVLAYNFDIDKLKIELDKVVNKNYKKEKENLINQKLYELGLKELDKKEPLDFKSLFDNYFKNDKFDYLVTDLNNKSDFLTFFRNEFQNKSSKLYLELYKLLPNIENVINIINASGGFALLAHPGLYMKEVMDNLDELLPLNIDGLECIHTMHTDAQIKYLINYCNKHNLLKSGGSDYHGRAKTNHDINNKKISDDLIDNWKDKINYI